MSKNNRFLDLFQVFLVAGLVLSIVSTSSSKEHIIEMTEHKFIPSKITIKKGDSIKFVNKSKNFHNVVAEKLKIRTKLIKKGDFLVIKPRQAGNFSYYCQPHKSMGMTGEVTVE